MAKKKLTQVTVQGLATNPNPNALPAGSCAVLQNAYMRRPGIISPASLFINKGSLTTPKKLLYSDFNSKVVAVTGSGVSLTPITLPSTIGSPITTLPKNTTGGTRALVLNPSTTQTAFSHFRSFINEKSGIITNLERWAGLPPPAALLALPLTSSNGFLLDGQAVAYRAHFSLESQDPTQSYIVDGPVSAIAAYLNDTGSTCAINFYAYAPVTEPFVIPTNCKLYINIYRSTQAVVDFVTELADDFLRVAQIEITSFPTSVTVLFADEVSDEARSHGIPLYTNNIGQGEPSNFAPPCATDVCVYKDTMFYANSSALPTLTLTVPGAYGALLSDHERLTGIGSREFVTASVTSGSPVITLTAASELIGVVPGQNLRMFGFATDTVVLSVNVGAKTITVDHNSSATGSPVSGTLYDMIKVTTSYNGASNVVQTARVLWFDFDAVINGSLPGFRLFYPAVDPDRVEEGIKLQLIYTWPALGVLLSGFTVCLTNGQNYYPAYTGNYVTATTPLKALTDTRPNRVFRSKTGLPEAVPATNYEDVGSGSIQKMWATQSCLFVFCTDGLWKITGDGSTFSVYQVDPTVYLITANAVTSLNNLTYAWVTDGIATITEDGATVISTDAVGPLLRSIRNVAAAGIPGESSIIGLTGDSFRNEVWLIASRSSEVPSNNFYTCVIYNDDTKNFSTLGDAINNNTLPSGAVFAPNVSRTAFFQANGGSSVFLLPSDYDEINDTQYFMPMTVWFNPNQTEDKGNLKQWMDLNFFTTNYTASHAVTATANKLKATFDAKGTATDATANTVNVNNLATLSRDVHYLVPRRTALSDQQQIGFRTFCLDVNGTEIDDYAPYVEIQGFTMRYRIASDTLKR